MKRWLASGQTYPINPIPKRNEPIHDLLERKGRKLLRAKNQGWVVAVAAAKVAIRQKDNRAEVAGPIDERGL